MIFVLCFLSACSSAKKSDILRVGLSPDFPPFAFKVDNKLEGSDIQMIVSIAQKIGKKIEFHEMDFNALIPSLLSGKIDVAISGISNTKERSEKVLFSKPYFIEKNCLLYNTKFRKFNTVHDIKENRVAATLGTTQQTVIEKYFPNCKFYNNNFQIIEEIKIGRIDAWVVGETQCLEFVSKYPFLKFFMLPESYNTESSFSIAMRKEDTQLANEINNALS